MNTPLDVLSGNLAPGITVKDYGARLGSKLQSAFTFVNARQEDELIKRRAKLRRKIPAVYEEGQLVLLRNARKRRKMEKRWTGPWTVFEQLSTSRVLIEWKGRKVIVHHDQLWPYHARVGTKFETNPQDPRLIEDDTKAAQEEVEYEIESLLEHAEVDGNIVFKVHWKGYPESEATWEPERNLPEQMRVLYWMEHPGRDEDVA